MRLLHAVTLVTPGGAFGGPVRVAENQVRELRGRGHVVSVVGGQAGFPGRPGEAGGAPQELGGGSAQLFETRRVLPGAGFSGLVAPGIRGYLRLALPEVDLLHVHLGRDLVTLPVALWARRAGVPYVLQTHGMVGPSRHPLARPLDLAATRRVLAGAAAVLYLTPQERTDLLGVAGRSLAVHQLGNGVPGALAAPLPDRPEALFCARLHERKRPLLFVRAAVELLAEGLDASFALVGPDEGMGAAVAEQVARVADPSRLRWEGPLPPGETLARMGRSSLLVLPSVDEPYPMSVLEALSAGRSVVLTSSCGLAPALEQHGGGVVVDESYEALLTAMRAALQDRAGLAVAGARAAVVAAEHFSMSAVGDELERIYAAAVCA